MVRNRKLELLEVMMADRDLIKDERNWYRGTAAKDINDNGLHYRDQSAYKFCTIGALYKASDALNPGSGL